MADSDATGWLERAGDIQGRPPGERGPSGWIRTLDTACRAGHDLFDTVVARTQDVAPCRSCAILERIACVGTQVMGSRVSATRLRVPATAWRTPERGASAPPSTCGFEARSLRACSRRSRCRSSMISCETMGITVNPSSRVLADSCFRAVLLPSNVPFESYRTIRPMSTPAGLPRALSPSRAGPRPSTTIERVFYRFRTLDWVRCFPCGS